MMEMVKVDGARTYAPQNITQVEAVRFLNGIVGVWSRASGESGVDWGMLPAVAAAGGGFRDNEMTDACLDEIAGKLVAFDQSAASENGD